MIELIAYLRQVTKWSQMEHANINCSLESNSIERRHIEIISLVWRRLSSFFLSFKGCNTKHGKTYDSTIYYCMLTVYVTDHLSKDWNASIYAFFHTVPSINYIGNLSWHIHIFKCNAKSCKGKGFNWQHVWRYLNTANGTSTSNLHCHTKICWGKQAVAAADAAKLHGTAYEIVEKSLGMPDGSITAIFKCIKENGIITYSHIQYTVQRLKHGTLLIICLCPQANKVISVEIVQ